ncbi:MAG: hypothetical protein U9Q82_00910, partial [Chloroflexota bacterium]|nr:hypothetical protein [Chloroflexota bacterium]
MGYNTGMRYKEISWFPVIIVIIVLIAVSYPYIYAARAGGGEYVFGGFLLNPLDGNSYLAKMYQGWSGSWRYRLAFSADPGEGAHLFLFYLFLGHLARVLGLPLLLVFHVGRLFGAAIMLSAMWRFFVALFPK